MAIIMDGNGRWAKKRLLNRVKGHEKGAETVRTVVEACRKLSISVLTLYAFSTENWQRPQKEVSALMHLLKAFLEKEKDKMVKNNIRLGVIGQPERLPENVRNTLDRVISATAQNSGLKLNLALSYGGRNEITQMVKNVCAKVSAGDIDPNGIDETTVAEHLFTKGLPDPDILIRTSGEMRVSNFMLWQLAYTELFVTNTLWPDFTEEEFMHIIMQYQNRDRRFGKVKR